MGRCELALGLLDLTHLVQLRQAYLLCLPHGRCSTVGVTARMAFVSEMVGPEQVTSVVAVGSLVGAGLAARRTAQTRAEDGDGAALAFGLLGRWPA